MDNETSGLSRRGLVAGGALVGAGALLGTPAVAHAAAVPMADPGGARIGSAPIGGYSYLHACSMDFFPLTLAARNFANDGVYGTRMVATFEPPPGAVLRDVEWYYSATATSSVNIYLWTTGNGGFLPIGGGGLGPTNGLKAARMTVPAQYGGPYKLGTKVLCIADTSSTWVINGVRAGFTTTPAGTVPLAAPVRVYDSRSGAKIGNGQTRIHSLASRIPAGATAAILNVSVTSGERSGGLAVYNTGSSLPSGSALYFNGGTTVSNEIHTKLPSDRKVKVTMRGVSGSKAHYFIDLVGYTA